MTPEARLMLAVKDDLERAIQWRSDRIDCLSTHWTGSRHYALDFTHHEEPPEHVEADDEGRVRGHSFRLAELEAEHRALAPLFDALGLDGTWHPTPTQS